MLLHSNSSSIEQTSKYIRSREHNHSPNWKSPSCGDESLEQHLDRIVLSIILGFPIPAQQRDRWWSRLFAGLVNGFLCQLFRAKTSRCLKRSSTTNAIVQSLRLICHPMGRHQTTKVTSSSREDNRKRVASRVQSSFVNCLTSTRLVNIDSSKSERLRIIVHIRHAVEWPEECFLLLSVVPP